MMRGRRSQQVKNFNSGGIYNPSANKNAQNQQQQQQQQYQKQQQPNQYSNAQDQRETQSYKRYPEETAKKEPIEVMKDEEVRDDTLESNANTDNNEMDTASLTDENGKLRFKKIFLNRKKSSVRTKERKIRQNRQLRKTITPKNALMALTEVKGIKIADFVCNNNTLGGFTAVVTVNDTQYEGIGASKAAAKHNACEKALRDYVVAQMVRHPRNKKLKPGNGEEPMDTENAENADNDQSKDSENGEDTDGVPMVNLASFALYKLFSEWENEGYVIPELHPATTSNGTNGTVTPKEPKKVSVRTELPSNWESLHPATLLCMMRPGVSYTDWAVVGEQPNQLQKLSLIVDDQVFFGTGRSKKIARRNASASVCNALFGTNFVIEEAPQV